MKTEGRGREGAQVGPCPPPDFEAGFRCEAFPSPPVSGYCYAGADVDRVEMRLVCLVRLVRALQGGFELLFEFGGF